MPARRCRSKAKLAANSARVSCRTWSSPWVRQCVERRYFATPALSGCSAIGRLLANPEHRAALQPVCPLFDLDPGVLDHLAPALFLAAKIAVELFRRLADHDEALVDAEFLEGVGLHGLGGRFVEAVDDIRRRLGRRIQAIPGFGRVAGNAGFRHRRQLRKCRRAFRRRHGDRAQLTGLDQRRGSSPPS